MNIKKNFCKTINPVRSRTFYMSATSNRDEFKEEFLKGYAKDCP